MLAAEGLQEPLREETRAALCWTQPVPDGSRGSPAGQLSPSAKLVSSLGKPILERAKPATQAKEGAWGQKGEKQQREDQDQRRRRGKRCSRCQSTDGLQPMVEQISTAVLLEPTLEQIFS